MIKAIFWDFDGVIAESVNVKTEAFYNLYLPYGIEIAEKVRRHHLDNGGMSRFEKFRYYQTRLLGEPEPVDEKAIKKLAAHFSELVLEGVINAPFVPDVEKVLREKSGKMDFYVISGTPTEEMRLIVEKRGLTSCFKGVFGSPESKSHWCAALLAEPGYRPEETLFIGDAKSDYNAARENKLTFLLRRHNDNKEIFSDYNGLAIEDFGNFDTVLDWINNEKQ